jgi:hypothetical protein
LPQFKIIYKSRRRWLHTEETRSEIIEAPDLSEAETIGRLRLGNYPRDWTVSVDQITP